MITEIKEHLLLWYQVIFQELLEANTLLATDLVCKFPKLAPSFYHHVKIKVKKKKKRSEKRSLPMQILTEP